MNSCSLGKSKTFVDKLLHFRFRKELVNREKAHSYLTYDTKIKLTKEEKQDGCTIINGRILKKFSLKLHLKFFKRISIFGTYG